MELEKINEFLSSWSNGVIEIGKIHREGGDYIKSAKLFLNTHYAFEETDVLFKPTFTKEVVFRNNKKDALSYFVGRDISEDNGFALKPWESIQLDELNTLTEEDITAAMGTLKFKPHQIDETTLVAFTFIFRKIGETLKIKVHHSSPVI
jgi:hypothetical protein|tara:strand:- start:8 stop:454 length:447 start_codon:yes stop_codon:yes gene_type:complete